MRQYGKMFKTKIDISFHFVLTFEINPKKNILGIAEKLRREETAKLRGFYKWKFFLHFSYHKKFLESFSKIQPKQISFF